MEDVVIIGAGGHGKVVLDILVAEGKYRPVGFVDNNPSLLDSYVCGLPVLGPINALPRLKRQRIRHAVVAIGDNRQRLNQLPSSTPPASPWSTPSTPPATSPRARRSAAAWSWRRARRSSSTRGSATCDRQHRRRRRPRV
jgi:hypothetical protein